MSTPQTTDLTRKQILQMLNLTSYELRQLERDKRFPRIKYNARVIRYPLPEVMHFREGLKQGAWFGEKKEGGTR